MAHFILFLFAPSALLSMRQARCCAFQGTHTVVASLRLTLLLFHYLTLSCASADLVQRPQDRAHLQSAITVRCSNRNATFGFSVS